MGNKLDIDKELSPCRGICSTTLSDICVGCGRTLEQVIEWNTYSDKFKREIIRGIQNGNSNTSSVNHNR